MPSTTALYTGLSGLSVNARQLDVIGNNIANVNSTAFKASRMVTTSTFGRSFSLGTAPSANTGGTNPNQVGFGAGVAGMQRNFNIGSITATGVPTDVAIEGDGFFITEVAGERMYTRAGAFQQNEANELVTINGGQVLGFPVDDLFQVMTGNVEPITVPVGSLTIAEATRNVTLNGNVNASGKVATTGSEHATRAFYTDAGLTTLLAAPAVDLTVPGNDLYIDDGAGGSFLALEGGAGTIITLSGVEKGGQDLGEHSFAFSATAVPGVDVTGTTLQDYMNFLQDVLGLDDSLIGGENLGGGVAFSAGVLTVNGNEGTVQDLKIETADLVATNAGSGISQPFVMTKTGAADGESVRTSFVAYDSLGTALTVDLTMILQRSVDGEGTVWEFIAESTDNDAIDRVVGLGVVRFDANGVYISATNQAFSLTRENGAVSPLTVSMDFNSGQNAVSSLSDRGSSLAAVFQDGSPIGTLGNFSIGEDGIITGAFSNGLTRTIGQIALAKFANPAGLVEVSGGNFRVGANSGEALIAEPLNFGTGKLLSGALELSNVDLSQEFINMILASTGYSASSRVITTTDELIDQLLLIGR